MARQADGFRGIFTIPSTPFRENGEIDIPGFQRIVDFSVECGAHGLVFPVNASEWIHLSDEERLVLSQALVERNRGRIPVTIGVSGATGEQAARFAAHARAISADAVIAMPPHIRRRPLSEAVICDYYRAISRAARLPVFIQNWYGPIGTEMSAQFLLRLCREIEYVQYIKEETEPSTIKLTEIVKGNDGSVKGCFGGAGGRYLIEEYRRGTDGNMPGCHVTDVVVALWSALESGEERRALHIYKEMAPLFFFETQVEGCYKEVLFRRGVIDCPRKRNGQAPLDEISSRYLDDILRDLAPLMTWGK
ncbi:MAG TPA: dihydrodipicolinate synthase family protein [Bryobacteraceae bacterium]|nr:dihydrodipicolinate synthase family protein [Bryobacteraceae bacterium]